MSVLRGWRGEIRTAVASSGPLICQQEKKREHEFICCCILVINIWYLSVFLIYLHQISQTVRWFVFAYKFETVKSYQLWCLRCNPACSKALLSVEATLQSVLGLCSSRAEGLLSFEVITHCAIGNVTLNLTRVKLLSLSSLLCSCAHKSRKAQ